MPVPTLHPFVIVRHHDPLLHVVLHGTPMHFHCEGLVFSHTNAVSLYRQPFQNEIAKAVTLACEMCVYSFTYMPHLIVIFTSPCRVLSNVYTPSPELSYFCKKKRKIVAITWDEVQH
jgi:hypothetical protein